MEVDGQCHARSLYPWERDTVPIVQEAGWAPGPVWTGAENLASTGIRSPDRPARSQPLYRLRYPDPQIVLVCLRIIQAAVKLQTGSVDRLCIDQMSQVGFEESITICCHSSNSSIFIRSAYNERIMVPIYPSAPFTLHIRNKFVFGDLHSF